MFERYNPKDELSFRIQQFSSLFDDVTPPMFEGLQFCNACKGQDYQWTNWSATDIDTVGLDIKGWKQARDYRLWMASNICRVCDGTGFKGGSFRMYSEDWLMLAARGRAEKV
jgi:hypothetical protein